MTIEFTGPVSLGDLVRACHRMQVTKPASIARIAAALGLEIDMDAMVSKSEGQASSTQLPSSTPPSSTPPSSTPPSSALPSSTPPSSALPSSAPPSTPPSETTPPVAIEPVKFEVEAEVIDKAPSESRQQTPGYVRFEYPRPAASPEQLPPLFEPRWQPSLLKELIALILPGRELDIPQMCDTLARCRWPRYLPYITSRLVSRGCQLLVDTGIGMEPFALDWVMLLNSLRSTLGDDRVEPWFFRDCPSFGVEDPETFDSCQWMPPIRRCPVLVVSDLGLMVPAGLFSYSTLNEWIRFAAEVTRFQLPLVFLVPCSRHRVPNQLRNHAAIIQWDRRTTIADVRRSRTHQDTMLAQVDQQR
jgi:hypothetical protein